MSLPTPQKKTGVLRFQHQWSDIASDMVLTLVKQESGKPFVTGEDICANYGLTPEECAELLVFPAFRKLLKDYKQRVDAMGETAATTLRTHFLYADTIERAYLAAVSAGEPKVLLDLAKHLANIAGLDPTTNGSNRQKDSPSGNMATIVNVSIPVPPGIGLDHLHTTVIEANK